MAWNAELSTLNPFYWHVISELDTLQLIYDTPFKVDQNGTLIPWLVESYEYDEEDMQFVFHLVRNATWHDGQPVTAEDFKYSIEFVRDHTLPYLGSVGEVIDSAEAIDTYTVAVTLKQPFSPIPLIMSDIFFVVPKHIWETVSDPGTFTNDNPVGSGPFKFVERRAGEYIMLEKNTNYFKGSPKIDKVIIKIIPSTDVQILALKTGELDVAELTPGPAVRDLMTEPNIRIVLAPSTYFTYLSLNLRRYPINLVEFRRAVAHAIDKDLLVSTIILGMGDVAHSLLVPGLRYWYNPNVTKYEYNVTKANQILDEIGFLDTNGNGMREYPNGTEIVLDMPTYNVDIWPRLSELLAGMLEDVGINVNVIPGEPNTILDMVLNRWDFDLFPLGWRLYFDPDPFIYESFHSSRIGHWGLNWAGYNSTEFDTLAEQQRMSATPEERRPYLLQMQEVLALDLPWIPLWYQDLVYAVRTDTIEGWIAVPRYGLRNTLCYLSLHAVGGPTETKPPDYTLLILGSVIVILVIIIGAVAYILYAKKKATRGTS
ncbi:MAG: ABC transporter substrate-binding protein [Candidatus Bathyarchaeia archaeon]